MKKLIAIFSINCIKKSLFIKYFIYFFSFSTALPMSLSTDLSTQGKDKKKCYCELLVVHYEIGEYGDAIYENITGSCKRAYDELMKNPKGRYQHLTQNNLSILEMSICKNGKNGTCKKYVHPKTKTLDALALLKKAYDSKSIVENEQEQKDTKKQER